MYFPKDLFIEYNNWLHTLCRYPRHLEDKNNFRIEENINNQINYCKNIEGYYFDYDCFVVKNEKREIVSFPPNTNAGFYTKELFGTKQNNFNGLIPKEFEDIFKTTYFNKYYFDNEWNVSGVTKGELKVSLNFLENIVKLMPVEMEDLELRLFYSSNKCVLSYSSSLLPSSFSIDSVNDDSTIEFYNYHINIPEVRWIVLNYFTLDKTDNKNKDNSEKTYGYIPLAIPEKVCINMSDFYKLVENCLDNKEYMRKKIIYEKNFS